MLLFDAYPDESFADEIGARFVSAEELLESSDIVSLHAPLTEASKHIIDSKALERMKNTSILVNTSRGALVDAAALTLALKEERIGGAALDVYEEESEYFFEDHSTSIIQDDLLARLLSFPNVLVTSHQAFLTNEALANIAETTCNNARAYLSGARGAKLENIVEDVDHFLFRYKRVCAYRSVPELYNSH